MTRMSVYEELCRAPHRASLKVVLALAVVQHGLLAAPVFISLHTHRTGLHHPDSGAPPRPALPIFYQ